MRKFVLFFFLVFMCINSIGQNNKDQDVEIISHQVQLGETVRMLSKKYLVDPKAIYKLNKFVVDGISSGMVLQIPVPRKVVKESETPVQNERDYQVSQNSEDENVNSGNSEVSANTIVESSKIPGVRVIDRNSHEMHIVQHGETLSGLSRQYNISVDEIRMSNGEALKKGLKVGQSIRIPSTKALEANESSIGSTLTPTNDSSQQQVDSSAAATKVDETVSKSINISENEVVLHKVEASETLYSLSKKYNVTVNDIKSQNPEVAKRGLQIGQQLKIRKSSE